MSDFKKLFQWTVFACPLILSLLMLGGVYSHIETNLIIIGVGASLFFLYFGFVLIFKNNIRLSPIIIPLFIILLYALIQLIPFDLRFLKLLSPTAAFFRSFTQSSKGPLTMSVPDTFYSILRVTVLILFSTTVTTIVHSKNKRWKNIIYVTMIFISTSAVMLAVILRIVEANSWLYGNLYKSSFLLDPVIINSNHAAGFFGVSSFFILALIYRTEVSRMRFFLGSLFFIHCIAVISTLSRAGIASFITALILFSVMNKFSSEKVLKHKAVIFFTALSLITVLYSGHTFLSKEFDFYRDGYFDKILLVTDAFQYLKDFLITGSGLGSFSRVFTYYQADPETRFTQLENEPFQFILETGLPFALLIFGIIIWLLLKKRADISYSGERNALIILLYFVTAQNLLDFNLHNFSTLFPVIIAISILLRPVIISGTTKKIVSSFFLITAVTVVFTVSYEPSRNLTGYNENFEYEKAVYFYPADYSIPFLEGIKRLNNSDISVSSTAGVFISDAAAKAPRYYYTYFMAGTYMLRIGSQKQAIIFFRKSAQLSERKLAFILGNIFKQMKNKNIESKIIETIPFDKNSREQIEIFLRTLGHEDPLYSEIINHDRELFFISNISHLIRNREFDEATKFIDSLEKAGVEMSHSEKGRIFIFKGDIARNNNNYKDAFTFYIAGSELTQDFNNYLQAARVSLRLGEHEISTIENKLKKQSFLSKNNMAGYHKWLSEREFERKSFMKGIEHLNKAISLNPSPGWILELYRHYNRNNLHFEAKKSLELLVRHHPNYRKEYIRQLIEEETAKISGKREKAYKEKILGK